MYPYLSLFPPFLVKSHRDASPCILYFYIQRFWQSHSKTYKFQGKFYVLQLFSSCFDVLSILLSIFFSKLEIFKASLYQRFELFALICIHGSLVYVHMYLLRQFMDGPLLEKNLCLLKFSHEIHISLRQLIDSESQTRLIS